MDASGEDAVQGATLQTFTESAEVLQLIDELPKVVCNLRKKEMAEERFTGGRKGAHSHPKTFL